MIFFEILNAHNILSGETDTEGNPSMRYVCAIDMAHCKAPHSCGVVAICVVYDGNDNVHIAAFAHVPTEDADQWGWFMGHLKTAFPRMTDSDRFCTISDQDKVWNCRFPSPSM